MSHVFLSYSRKNITLMQRVRDELRAAEIDVWTDENLTPGEKSWRDGIEKAIETAGALVVLMSPDSKRSKYVEKEISYATTWGLPIFPVLVSGEERESVPFELSNMQWVDARTNSRAVADLLLPALRQIPEIVPLPAPKQATPPTAGSGTTLPATNLPRATVDELAKLVGFSPADLVANRAGKLTEKQRRKHRGDLYNYFVFSCLFGIPGSFLLYELVSGQIATGTMILWRIILGILFSVMIIVGLAGMEVTVKIMRGHVDTITGRLERAGKRPNPTLRLNGLVFRISYEAWSTMAHLYGGRYRGYRIGTLSKLLSIEPWNEDTYS